MLELPGDPADKLVGRGVCTFAPSDVPLNAAEFVSMKSVVARLARLELAASLALDNTDLPSDDRFTWTDCE